MIEFSTYKLIKRKKKKLSKGGKNIFKGNHVKQDESENRDAVSAGTWKSTKFRSHPDSTGVRNSNYPLQLPHQ